MVNQFVKPNLTYTGSVTELLRGNRFLLFKFLSFISHFLKYAANHASVAFAPLCLEIRFRYLFDNNAVALENFLSISLDEAGYER